MRRSVLASRSPASASCRRKSRSLFLAIRSALTSELEPSFCTLSVGFSLPAACSFRWFSALPALLLALLVAVGCSRVPKIIVLEDPLTAAEHVELGVAYERKGELDLARREYEMALRKDKKFFLARLNLGNVFLAKKEYGNAREEYLRALELRPGDPEATNNLSWAALESGEGIDDALARMEAVVSGPSGRRATLLDTLGVLRMRANRPESAEEAFVLAETLCGESDAVPRESVQGTSPCPEEVRREIDEHRRELRRRYPFPASPPALIK